MRTQRGFTLLEVLVALALSAILATLVFASFSYAEKTSTAGLKRSDEIEDLRRGHAFLREHLEGLLPLRYQKSLGQPLRFKGERDKLIYVSPIISRIAEGGTVWWELAVTKQDTVSALTLRRVALDNLETSLPDFNDTDKNILAENIKSIRFSYFDQEDPKLTGIWVDDWPHEQRLPKLIRVEVESGGGLAWPELVISPQISLEVGCPNWEQGRKRCNIPGAAIR
jgi:general secretion pathway protein J